MCNPYRRDIVFLMRVLEPSICIIEKLECGRKELISRSMGYLWINQHTLNQIYSKISVADLSSAFFEKYNLMVLI